ncbi:mobilization protein [Kitasatospora sp. YST-16]|uniref:relaxase/mobilization nuclease domain-containing protein n=1 Tax=Kitasatospora sp. YST-16 TaxID=2998080 RepID=UPI002283ED92|nr:mobilization protein [Kitasatospora sp. YST-16]WAL74574.1 mobilization protein [Kitasatospora sp. YST-16]WNW40632.1 mobilization protein [Streptomyces sp. Li-HN-5-13]
MVPDISRGSKTYGLLAYLFGPGKHDEHVDPHIVASWDGFAPDPGRDPAATLSQLEAALDLRVNQLGDRRPKRHVWHCPVSADPGDRLLTDEEWAEVARRVVAAAGIAEPGDPDGCRWIAVRHDPRHIHIMATIVRGDLRQARLNKDAERAQAECRQIEKDFGLKELNQGDGTAAKRPTSAEGHKAQRLGRGEPVRLQLRDAVRRAVAGAADEDEFLDRLKTAGLLVSLKIAPSGDVLGYSVAHPDDRNAQGQPVFFGGSRLAPDLSLPRIRKRLGTGPLQAVDNAQPAGAATGQARVPGSRAAQARRGAADAVESAARAIDEGDDGQVAAQLAGAIEVIDVIAIRAPADTRAQLLAAARAFERASRSHVRAERADNRALRYAARQMLSNGYATNRGEDGGATAMLLSALVLLAIAAARWHSGRGHAQQAAAAAAAARELRAAYGTVAARPMAAMAQGGRRLPPEVRERQAEIIRTRLAETEGAPREREGWDALAATLAEAEAAGHDPAALLDEAKSWRELDSADSVTAVMVWRVRRIAGLSAVPAPAPAPAAVQRGSGPRTGQAAAAAPAPRRRPTR